MADAYICYCSLTSEPHVIEDGVGCGRCTEADTARAVTPVHVAAALKFFRDRLEDEDDDDDNDGEEKAD